MSGHSDAYGTEVFNDTPIGYWRFDGDGVDEMGVTSATLTNGAAANGATCVSTYSGAAALDVDGTNDYASVPDDNLYDLVFNATLECWINADAFPSGAVIFGKNQWALSMSNAKARMIITTPGFTATEYATDLSTGTNYHLVGTYDGTTVRFYVNGVERATTARTDALAGNALPLTFGTWNTTQDFFNGRIDECAIYNRALTAQEVADHYTVGTGGSVGAKSAPIRRRPARGLILR